MTLNLRDTSLFPATPAQVLCNVEMNVVSMILTYLRSKPVEGRITHTGAEASV